MECFLIDFFLFIVFWVMGSHLKNWDIYISFQGEETCEDLIIVPHFVEVEEIFSMIFYFKLEGFFKLYLVFLFWLNVLNYYCLFLLGCLYCWLVVIIVEESFNLGRWIL